MTPIYLEPNQQAAVEVLKAANGVVESAQLELSLCLDREEVFSMVTDLMASGVPVYFENEVESGLRIPEGPLMYRYARKPEVWIDVELACNPQQLPGFQKQGRTRELLRRAVLEVLLALKQIGRGTMQGEIAGCVNELLKHDWTSLELGRIQSVMAATYVMSRGVTQSGGTAGDNITRTAT